MIKSSNILFLESLGHKKRLFKLVQHLLYSLYDLSEMLFLENVVFLAKWCNLMSFRFTFVIFLHVQYYQKTLSKHY